MTTCPHCGYQWEPIEPLFDMSVAALFIPMTYDALKRFLSRHKDQFPARYRLSGREHRRVRLISAQEIREIRAKVLRGPGRPTLDLVMRSFDAGFDFMEGGAAAATGNPRALP
jgi:hypothetical protein